MLKQEVFEKVKVQLESVEQELGALHGVLQKKDLTEDEDLLLILFLNGHFLMDVFFTKERFPLLELMLFHKNCGV